jgi:signal transduction histidine kinase
VTITLRFDEAVVELRVQDNGRGFDPAAVSVHSLGLGIMRDRAAKIGAELQIESRLGEGTAVFVRASKAASLTDLTNGGNIGRFYHSFNQAPYRMQQPRQLSPMTDR